MPSRHELNLRARAVGLDPATIVNDSKLEQKVLYLEKNATAFTGTAGTRVITSSGVAQNNETVTIGSRTYTFKTALTASTTANEVLIGANAAASLQNLADAINGTGTAGTQYGSQTPVNEQVTATNDATTLTATVRDTAVTNADIATTETMTNWAWAGATITGGVAKVVAVPSANTAGVKDTNAGVAGDKNVL
jgi:hypothetical protein